MRLKTLRHGVDLSGKRVLLRIDGNVPVIKGKAIDGLHGKIARSAVDIEWLRQRGAKVVVMTHLGRPDGKVVAAYSLRPVAKRLSELLMVDVKLSRDIAGPFSQKLVSQMKNGDIVLLENLRFDAGEERNSTTLAHALAQLADLYMNDAFAVSHRAHASVDAITSELPSYAGPLVVSEVGVMEKVLKSPKHPFLLVMGGLKMIDKIPVMKRLLPHTDHVLVGGALAHVFFLAHGFEIGSSVYDPDGVKAAAEIIKLGKEKISLPTDVIVVTSLRKDAKRQVKFMQDVLKTDRIVDLGPETIARYQKRIQQAKMIVWNGPLGYTECEAFQKGTLEVAMAISKRTGKATTVVGGGDTIPVVESAGLADRFTLLSTGGGAMLEFLSGKKLPGIEALDV